MAIATAAAIALAAGAASAGSSVYAAKKGSDAAKKAALTQAQSARDAQGMAGSMFQQQQQMQSPYMALGGNAAMTLGRLMGQPAGSRFAAPPMNLGQFGGGGGPAQFPSGVPVGVQPLGPQAPQGPPAFQGGPMRGSGGPMGPPMTPQGPPPVGPPQGDPRRMNLGQFGGGY